jgi:hypothetical protein
MHATFESESENGTRNAVRSMLCHASEHATKHALAIMIDCKRAPDMIFRSTSEALAPRPHAPRRLRLGDFIS